MSGNKTEDHAEAKRHEGERNATTLYAPSEIVSGMASRYAKSMEVMLPPQAAEELRNILPNGRTATTEEAAAYLRDQTLASLYVIGDWWDSRSSGSGFSDELALLWWNLFQAVDAWEALTEGGEAGHTLKAG